MDKLKRAYYLPRKLIDALDKESVKSGYVREKVVAAALLDFLDSNPDARAQRFERLDKFLRSKK
jgi:hypothetical protein